MTAPLKRPEPLRRTHIPSSAAARDEIPHALASQGATLLARRGQSLPLRLDSSETVFIVRTATLMFRVALREDLRQVVTLLYPGDVFRAAFAPLKAEAHLSAVSAGEVLRLRFETFATLAAEDPAVAAYFDKAVAQQTARQAIHLAAVGQLDCLQRLATFLTELALYTGTPAPDGGVVIEMPLSRSDMADHLGINADTLSRTMSRLRAAGLLRQPNRQKAFIHDLSALAVLTPAAPPLMALHDEVSGESLGV